MKTIPIITIDGRRLGGNVPEAIRTVAGVAYYQRTEVEDENGNWNDSGLSTRNGYWVIHKGPEHHIYKI